MNKVILAGRPTRDPEVRYSQGREALDVGRFTIAVDRKYKREGEPAADFIPCKVFGKPAEFAESKRESQQGQQAPPECAGNGFMNIPDGVDEELPFN